MAADPQSGESRLRELAERLMTHPHPEGHITTRLVVGELPSAMDVNLPLPAEAVVVGSRMQHLGGRRAAAEAVLDVTGEATAILDAYAEAAERLGWVPFASFGRPHGGFVATGMGDGRMLRWGSEGPMLIASATERDGAPTDVRLRLDWEMVRNMPQGPRAVPLGAELMPVLHAPSGASMQASGSSGGDGRWTSEATLRTERTVAELDEHFADQLVRAGWNRSGGGSDEAVAWSAWQLPAPDEWRGMLAVLAPFGGTARFVSLRIERSALSD